MDGFSNLKELFDRVKPALKSKVKDLKRIGINYVTEIDVWNYLKINYWCKKPGLTLGDIVNDIMTVSNEELENYVQSIMIKEKKSRRDEETPI